MSDQASSIGEKAIVSWVAVFFMLAAVAPVVILLAAASGLVWFDGQSQTVQISASIQSTETLRIVQMILPPLSAGVMKFATPKISGLASTVWYMTIFVGVISCICVYSILSSPVAAESDNFKVFVENYKSIRTGIFDFSVLLIAAMMVSMGIEPIDKSGSDDEEKTEDTPIEKINERIEADKRKIGNA